jgi:hypothetical protein
MLKMQFIFWFIKLEKYRYLVICLEIYDNLERKAYFKLLLYDVFLEILIQLNYCMMCLFNASY